MTNSERAKVTIHTKPADGATLGLAVLASTMVLHENNGKVVYISSSFDASLYFRYLMIRLGIFSDINMCHETGIMMNGQG